MTITKKNLILSMILGLTSLLFTLVSCKDDDMLCEEVTWYEDADNDGLGNPMVSQNACEQPEGYVSNADDIDDTKGDGIEFTCRLCRI